MIVNAIIIEIVLKFKLSINFPPINIPKRSIKNIGRNLKLFIPCFIFIWKKVRYNYRKNNIIIALVGGNIKAMIGTENIDIPMPTDPLTIPPIKIDNKIKVIVKVSK